MQKITPCLWFDTHTEEAMNRYISYFPNSRVQSLKRYPEGYTEGPLSGMDGKVITAFFELAGQRFMALDGGPQFRFTPAISFFINADSVEEVNRLWEQLYEGGMALMPLDNYGFSEQFGWLNDRYGLSWQVNAGARSQKITPALLFVGDQNGRAEEAMNFYISLFDDSGIDEITRYGADTPGGDEGTVQTALFRLHGQEFRAADSSYEHDFMFNEAISLFVECETQEEIDHFWHKLSAHPEAEQCGWLKDKFGVSWQISPRILDDLLNDPDPEKAQRVMDTMLQMKKFDIEKLKQA